MEGTVAKRFGSRHFAARCATHRLPHVVEPSNYLRAAKAPDPCSQSEPKPVVTSRAPRPSSTTRRTAQPTRSVSPRLANARTPPAFRTAHSAAPSPALDPLQLEPTRPAHPTQHPRASNQRETTRLGGMGMDDWVGCRSAAGPGPMPFCVTTWDGYRIRMCASTDFTNTHGH